jgi:Zn-dependent protease
MRIKFSKVEIQDLTKAWVIVSIVFAIVLSGKMLGIPFLLNFLLAGITVGPGFLLHELGHKVVAQRYGCWAEFRANNYMLLLAIVISFFDFIFIAPGAVMIAGRVSKERNGKISIAGPGVNIILALLFIPFSFLFQSGFLAQIVSFGILINLILALFNLIPFWILDGKKIWNWSKPVWFTAITIIVALFILKRYLPLVAPY